LFALHIIFVGRYSPHSFSRRAEFSASGHRRPSSLVGVPVWHGTGWERAGWTGMARWCSPSGHPGIRHEWRFPCRLVQQYTQHTTRDIFSLEPVFAGLTPIWFCASNLAARAARGRLILAGIVLAELKGPTQAAAESPGRHRSPKKALDTNLMCMCLARRFPNLLRRSEMMTSRGRTWSQWVGSASRRQRFRPCARGSIPMSSRL